MPDSAAHEEHARTVLLQVHHVGQVGGQAGELLA
jgi:hypothetical protein